MNSPDELPALPAIMWETGADESFLVGSEDELRRFAQSILTLLECREQEEDFLGVKVRWATGYVTEEFGDVCVVIAAVTSDTADTRRLINAVRKNNGEAPIAGLGWPDADAESAG